MGPRRKLLLLFRGGLLCCVVVGKKLIRNEDSQLKDHHFDTLKFVQRLKDEGFTEEQAEGMMRILSDVIEER